MISSSLTTAITNADILPWYHPLIKIHLASNNKPRGPGFWKSLLESEFIELIKKTIDEAAMEGDRNNDDVDAVLLWDTMKMQIRSLKYAREKKAKKRKKTNPHQFLGVAAAVVSFLNLFPQSS